MAYDLLKTKSINATVAITDQYVFVTIDTNGKIVVPGAGANAVGVCQDKPGVGDPGAVCFPGDITKVLAAGTITPGQLVTTDAAGKAVVAASGNHVLGVALTAGAAGFLMDIIYQPEGRLLP